MNRNCGCKGRMRQKGGGFSELPGRQLALAGQRILHGFRQAAEEMSVEEGVGVRRKQGLHIGEQREHMPITEGRVIYEPEQSPSRSTIAGFT